MTNKEAAGLMAQLSACNHPSKLNPIESWAHRPGSRPTCGHRTGTESETRSGIGIRSGIKT